MIVFDYTKIWRDLWFLNQNYVLDKLEAVSHEQVDDSLVTLVYAAFGLGVKATLEMIEKKLNEESPSR